MDKIDSPDKIVGLMTEATIEHLDLLERCSDEDLANAMHSQGVHSLPLSYNSFLLAAGRNKGGFLRGTDMCMPLLASFHSDAADLVIESSAGLVLPQGCFVFAFHQGYSFVFLESVDVGVDNVLAYSEGDEAFTNLHKTFEKWFVDTLAEPH